MELTPGQLLNNRYCIQTQLGQGGMGAVFLAMDTALEHPVAIKVNRNPAVESPAQFMREARLLANLRHPNLPRVIDTFQIDRVQYLVMDYIPGDDLSLRIEREGPQPPEQVLRWAEQLGSALTYLHSQNPAVIHRDIKPANLKLSADGEVILVDFGIAKVTDASQAVTNNASGYTPGFAPPEQYAGTRTGPYSDQYAFAATLYVLFTGQQPADSVQRALGKAVLIPPAEINPSIPKTINDALLHALAVRPDERYASVAEFVKALNGAVSSPGVERPAVPAGTLQAPPAARKGRNWIPLGIGAAALALGCVLVAVVGVVFMLNRSSRAAFIPPGPTQTLAAVQDTQPAAVPTPEATVIVVAAVTAEPSPQPTTTPEPTQTLEPSATPSSTATPNLLGSGGWIAFSSNRGDGQTSQLWKMRVALNDLGQMGPVDLVQLTFDGGDKTQPAWSPDGKELLYVAPGVEPEQGLDIWVMEADGSQPVNLTARKGDDTDPFWSPDGKSIAFTSHGRADGVPQIYLMDPDGANQDRISLEYAEWSPIWTPDMQWLFYIISASSHDYFYMRSQAGEYETPVPYDRATIFGRLGKVAHPSISPNGDRLAYTRLEGSSARVCTVVFSSRGADIDILTTTNDDSDPAWSSDSKWIVFTSLRDGNAEIYIMSDGGTQQTNLTLDPAQDQQPVWQPVSVP